MENSERFQKLQSELARLQKNLLPEKWSPTGEYSDCQIDQARAYRLLAHAEIEYFVENILSDVVTEKYEQWKKTRRTDFVLLCLVVAGKFGWQDVETKDMELKKIEPLKIKDSDESVYQILERAVEQYANVIKDNNGIRSRDLKRLIMPIGLALSDLDETWLSNMNSFGGKRGSIAHTSRLGIINVPDPKTEKEIIDSLIEGLKALDEKVLKIKKG